MERLVVGVPARNEAATIADLAVALEQGAAMLGEGVRCELVLAYQPGMDDTLARWQSHPFRLPNRVLRGADGEAGKGRNVKRLIRYARARDAHLLLVDGDLGSYEPQTVAAFCGGERLVRGGLVLPLWCRPRDEGNSTDFLACPLFFASLGARVRHPLAGQRLLTNQLLASVDCDQLPDDYGIDVALTGHALVTDRPVVQVTVPFPAHQAGRNSDQIMGDVASTLLAFVAASGGTDRSDVRWPDQWWRGQQRTEPAPRSFHRHLDPVSEPGHLSGLLEVDPEQVRDFWCAALAASVRQARLGADPVRLVADLVQPFFVHAEYRRNTEPDLNRAEAYVAELSERLAAELS
jgi:hypothetical protein